MLCFTRPAGVARQILLPSEQLAQHGDLGVIWAGGTDARIAFRARLLVGPMRRNAGFGMLVHRSSANLDLQRASAFIAHDGMQALVAVGLGSGDVVIKLTGNRRKNFTHAREGRIAGGSIWHDHSHRPDIQHLIKIELLTAHFFDDAVNMLGATLHLRLDAVRSQILLQRLAQSLHPSFALRALFIQLPGNRFVGFRLQKSKRQILHLPFNLPDAQSVGQRGKHMQRLGSNPLRRSGFDGCKIAQSLQTRGQAKHDHAQIAREGQQHLANVLGLVCSARTHLRGQASGSRLALHLDQARGFHGQGRIAFAKCLGDDLLRLVQMLPGIHQIAGRLHGL